MTKIAFLCSGQGSQEVGMGVDFVSAFPEVADLFETAKDACGMDVFDLCNTGPSSELSQTQNTQPCLVTVSIGIAKALRKRGIEPDCVAGFSLGEYAAHVIAGTLDEETALQLVGRRGAVMAMAANNNPGGMAALLKCTPDQAALLCSKHAKAFDQVLAPANLNCPGQVVISGQTEALDAACEDWAAQGGRFSKVATSGAFHSPLMQQAADMMRPALHNTLFGPNQIPLYCNVDARPLNWRESEDALYRQITSPVLWEQTIRNMIDDGVDCFIECGPGKTLINMVKRTAKDMGAEVKMFKCATVADLEAIDV